MGEVDEHLESLADNVVALLPANAGDEPYAAGIVLVPRIIKPLGLWCADTTIRSVHGIPFDEDFSVQNAIS
jgi:hypothetical protein